MFSRKFKYIIRIILNYRNWLYILSSRVVNKAIKKVVLRSGTKIIGGSKSLTIDIVDEIFIREVYNPSFLKINKGDVVLDIGANVGIFSLYAAFKGATNIYSIEPLRENIDYIKFNFKNNNLDYPKIANMAISDKTGKEKLYLFNYDSHSILGDSIKSKKNNNFRFVKTISLDAFVESNNIRKIDFLKIDCEGGEGKILSFTRPETWNRISKIAIEYHNNVSILNNTEMSALLRKYGYNVKIVKSDNTFGYIYAWR